MDLYEKIQNGVQDLPTLPTVYSALSDAMAKPSSTAEEIAEIVSADQASAFRVLKVVNSAFYGFPGRIDSISRAVVILGFDEIRNLILATSVMDIFGKRDSALDFRPGDFWAHSIAVGLLTRMIGQAAGVVAQENLFVAGVVHDIGKLAFFELAEEEFARALSYAAERNCPIRDAEQEVLGLDHAQAGMLLAEQWRLPLSLKNAIRFHHEGRVANKPDAVVGAVHVADFVARALEMGYPGDSLVPQPNEQVWESLRMREKAFEEAVPGLMRQYQDTIGLLLHS